MKTFRSRRWTYFFVTLVAATVLATAWLRLPLVWVILGLGSIAVAVAWRRLRP